MRTAWILTAALAAATFAAVPEASAQTAEKQDSLSEAPHWPIGLRLSDDLVGERSAKKKNRPGDVLIWLPEGARKFRAMMLVVNNTDSKNFHQHAKLREVCSKHEVAIVYLRHFYTGIEYHHKKPVSTPPAAPDQITKALDAIAKELNMPEFRHAPWTTLGKSSRGEFPFRMGWVYPERTIAGMTWHGETPTWPIPDWAAKQDQTILYLAVNGQEEWSGTWYRHVRPSLLNYHHNTAWLAHQFVSPGVGHGSYVNMHGSKGWGKPAPKGQTDVLKVWDYMSMFVDAALTLRLPEKGYPTDGPLKLRQVDPAGGYLIHPRAIEELIGMKWMAFREKDGEYQRIPWPDEEHPVVAKQQGKINPELLIRKYTDVPENERDDYMWCPTKELAEAWLELENTSGKDVTVP
ncbi:MAG: hypothetical protein ACLFUJ_13660 [Phycisphaerae bacterium]